MAKNPKGSAPKGAGAQPPAAPEQEPAAVTLGPVRVRAKERGYRDLRLWYPGEEFTITLADGEELPGWVEVAGDAVASPVGDAPDGDVA